MLKVFYEVYWNDKRIQPREKDFKSLEEISDWFFAMMRCDYTGDDNYAISVPRERDGVYPKEPTIIRFRPSLVDPDYTIRKITDGDSIVYSDGTYTCRQKFWTDEVREWCRQCEERRKNPSFNFADKAAAKPHKNASCDPAQAEQGQNAYVVCYSESCVRDVEVCIKDPAEADPVGDEWIPVDSAKLFVGIFKAGSGCLAVEAAAKAEGCDKACLVAMPVPKPVEKRLYHVYKKNPGKLQANVRNAFKRKKQTSDVAAYYHGLRSVMNVHAESGIQAVEIAANKLGLDKGFLVAIPKNNN